MNRTLSKEHKLPGGFGAGVMGERGDGALSPRLQKRLLFRRKRVWDQVTLTGYERNENGQPEQHQRCFELEEIAVEKRVAVLGIDSAS